MTDSKLNSVPKEKPMENFGGNYNSLLTLPQLKRLVIYIFQNFLFFY